MNKLIALTTGTGLHQRLIEDMSVRGFTAKTRLDYIRSVTGFVAFLGRSHDTATAEDTASLGCARRTGWSMPSHRMPGRRPCWLICRVRRQSVR